MAEKLLRLDIITPEQTIVSEDVNWVIAPGETGEFQVYAGHTPFLTVLHIGQIMYDTEGNRKYLCISGGFCEVVPDRALILARSAECPLDIDPKRAEAARDRAMNRLAGKDSIPVDELRASSSLQRALNRLKTWEMQ